MSVIFEFSRKGFSAERTLFATEIHCGFFSVLITREAMIERIVKMLKLYKLMKSGGEGACDDAEADHRLREMGARGVVPVQRHNPRFVQKFPNGIHKS